ncbi:APH(3')-I family aminoglycoside O-phosphotransferase [Sphingomonas yunnanensis]|uniref:APH(3')-I family aminoglycoside O-phosphotransferase n=1 Tax=Sphingomonas yunnanensis TaxID=310400 RepID=UPI001CA693DF|nr:APH(3')-I family aminoglycoside O-phosphotransferase [Sphingomonas yunnanensis]MBY9062104.1 APH(3')-I family aminoglycoside O-phosphotransferase [Sphingomonas yunnanensis]
MERETPCAPALLPPALAEALAGYRWARDTVGESGGAVYHLRGAAGAPDLYLKHGRGSVAEDITDEMTRLVWLAPRVAVPALTHFTRDTDAAWLVTRALDGETAYQLLETEPEQRVAVVDALANFLRRLHALPPADCPFTADHRHRLRRARARIDAGLVEGDEFDDARRGWSAEQVWAALTALTPFTAESVVTHGDYSLDNLLLRDGSVLGCIDVGRAGIADRYQDIAILWNCLGEFGGALQERFLDRYGARPLDRRRLDFHLMLDELF